MRGHSQGLRRRRREGDAARRHSTEWPWRCTAPQGAGATISFGGFVLQRFDQRRVVGRRPRFAALVDVGLMHPRPHRLRPVTELTSNPEHGPVIRAELRSQLPDEPDRLSLLLLRISTRGWLPRPSLCRQNSILVSKVRSLQLPQGDSVLIVRSAWLLLRAPSGLLACRLGALPRGSTPSVPHCASGLMGSMLQARRPANRAKRAAR